MKSRLRQSSCFALVALLVAGCGNSAGQSHVDLSGKSPAEGSMLAAQAICRRQVTCGTVEVSCSQGSGAPTQCSATIVHPDYDRCFNNAQPDLQHLLECGANTAGADTLQPCVDALANQECVTQAQADAAARDAEMNMTAPSNPMPPECDFLKWLSDCG